MRSDAHLDSDVLSSPRLAVASEALKWAGATHSIEDDDGLIGAGTEAYFVATLQARPVFPRPPGDDPCRPGRNIADLHEYDFRSRSPMSPPRRVLRTVRPRTGHRLCGAAWRQVGGRLFAPAPHRRYDPGSRSTLPPEKRAVRPRTAVLPWCGAA